MEKVFLQMVDNHQGIIYKVCRMYRDSKEDQEDLFQEIVLQLWKAFPTFKKEAKISSWIYRIALNTAIAIFRKKKVQLEFQENLTEPYQNIAQNEKSEHGERLFDAIRQLNEADRAIIALYLEDYSYKEIATIIGISENYLGVRINRIKNKLKTLIN